MHSSEAEINLISVRHKIVSCVTNIKRNPRTKPIRSSLSLSLGEREHVNGTWHEQIHGDTFAKMCARTRFDVMAKLHIDDETLN